MPSVRSRLCLTPVADDAQPDAFTTTGASPDTQRREGFLRNLFDVAESRIAHLSGTSRPGTSNRRRRPFPAKQDRVWKFRRIRNPSTDRWSEATLPKKAKKFTLERKFDLPSYELVGRNDNNTRSKPALIFHVSAVGFNRDRTRALVYVGHHCGMLCGGGRYHVLVKTDGRWQEYKEFRGGSCFWAS